MKEYSFLSNFYPDTKFVPFPYDGFTIDNVKFRTLEYFFQYMKFKTFGTSESKAYAELLLKCSNSKKVKQMGGKGAFVDFAYNYVNKSGGPKITKKVIKQEFENYIETVWKPMSTDVMYIGLMEKFQEERMKKELLATGKAELGEKRSWPKPSYWTRGGNNMLGVLIMKVRDEKVQSLK
ncbi:hypothetical protein HDV06_006820 [Boothiomyces sp. JEL0866]|nr:hypothetical protein HDV06_006820 [Boothiomyces sp. JEL0866]